MQLLTCGAGKTSGKNDTKTNVCRCIWASDLCRFLSFEWGLSIIADLPQSGTKSPLVSCNAKGRRILYTLWSDPRDAKHTVCMKKKKKSHLQEAPDDHTMADWKKRGGVKAIDPDKDVVQWLLLGRKKQTPSVFSTLFPLFRNASVVCKLKGQKNCKSSGNRREGQLIDIYKEMFAFHCLAYWSMCASTLCSTHTF